MRGKNLRGLFRGTFLLSLSLSRSLSLTSVTQFGEHHFNLCKRREQITRRPLIPTSAIDPIRSFEGSNPALSHRFYNNPVGSRQVPASTVGAVCVFSSQPAHTDSFPDLSRDRRSDPIRHDGALREGEQQHGSLLRARAGVGGRDHPGLCPGQARPQERRQWCVWVDVCVCVCARRANTVHACVRSPCVDDRALARVRTLLCTASEKHCVQRYNSVKAHTHNRTRTPTRTYTHTHAHVTHTRTHTPTHPHTDILIHTDLGTLGPVDVDSKLSGAVDLNNSRDSDSQDGGDVEMGRVGSKSGAKLKGEWKPYDEHMYVSLLLSLFSLSVCLARSSLSVPLCLCVSLCPYLTR